MQVKLYTQPGCPQCQLFKTLLDKKNIQYEKIEDIELMKSKGINHTPTLEVDGQLYVGKPALDMIKGM